jgi:hypothetical protein
MLIGSTDKYTRVAFDNEAEIEGVVADNTDLLFGPYIIYLPKTKISTVGGFGTIPDGIVVDIENGCWYIVEAERASHGTWDHIAPQVSKQLTAVSKQGTLDKIADLAIEQLNNDEILKSAIIDELLISEIHMHKRIAEIVKNNPIVAIPIDDEPADLREWAGTLKHEVRVWLIKKYESSNTKQILYSIPDEEVGGTTITSKEDTLPGATKAGGSIFRDLLKAGKVHVADKLDMEYGPRGQEKKQFTGIVRDDGLEVDGKVYSLSYAAVLCMQKAGSKRKTANGWIMWRDKNGKLMDELYTQLTPDQKR